MLNLGLKVYMKFKYFMRVVTVKGQHVIKYKCKTFLAFTG